MNSKISITVFLTLFTLFVAAQSKLSGRVTDSKTNDPLAGATVSINGKSTVTDKQGRFSIDCNGAKQLTVSFVGFQSSNVAIKNCDDELKIRLAAKEGVELSNVDITATSAQSRSILYQPASIAKLGETEIRRGTGLFMDDAINANIPGVSMQRRTVAAGQQFNIRGYGNGVRGTNGLNSNFDGQGYKMYLNGIPVTDAEGITLMDDIDFGSIGNVEVTKGPAGSLYGLAVAGVINLKTVRPEKGQTSVGQDFLVGNYGLRRFTTHYQTANDRSSILANFGYQESKGFMSHTASTKRFANFIGEFQLNEKQSLNTYFGYSSSYDQRGGELTITQYNNRDYRGNPEYIRRDAHSQVISFRAGIGHTYNFNDRISNTTTLFGTGMSSNVSSAGGWTDKDPINFGVRSTFETKFPLKNGGSLNGITGIEAQGQHAQIIGYNMVPNPINPLGYWVVGAARSNQFTLSSTASLFTEWTLTLPSDISITAGVGSSNMKIVLNDRFYVPNSILPTKYEKTYRDMVSPHFAINKVFSKQYSVYASYSKGYKAPVSSYFFIPATGQLNNGLRPEIGEQFEIGSKGVTKDARLSYQLAFFQATFSDKMTAIAVPLNGSTTTTAYSYIANGGKQEHKGIEAQLKYTAYRSSTAFINNVTPFFNMAYSDFKYKGYQFQTLNAARTGVVALDLDGKAVAGVPKWTTNLGVDILANCGIYANAVYSYKDKFPISSDGVNMTSSYNLVNAKIGYKQNLGGHWELDAFFGANNLGGVQYPLMVFVNQLPDAYMPAPLETNYFGGLNVKFIF